MIREDCVYDAQSKPAMVEYNGTFYRYVHNLQGDIVGIIDSAGSLVVEYRYDAWGNPISTTGSLKTSLGELNPFRYRGYVWDIATSMYYLETRYYAEEVGRFLNIDSILPSNNASNNNLYNYCRNTPINSIDGNGMEPKVLPLPSRPLDWDKEYRKDHPYVYSINRTQPAKQPLIVRICNFIKNTIEGTTLEAGVGLGLYKNVAINGSSASIGGKRDYLHMVLEKDNIDIGCMQDVSFEVVVNGVTYGYSRTAWHSFFDDRCTCFIRLFPGYDCPAWEVDTGSSLTTKQSFGLYFIGGGEVSISESIT